MRQGHSKSCLLHAFTVVPVWSYCKIFELKVRTLQDEWKRQRKNRYRRPTGPRPETATRKKQKKCQWINVHWKDQDHE